MDGAEHSFAGGLGGRLAAFGLDELSLLLEVNLVLDPAGHTMKGSEYQIKCKENFHKYFETQRERYRGAHSLRFFEGQLVRLE